MSTEELLDCFERADNFYAKKLGRGGIQQHLRFVDPLHDIHVAQNDFANRMSELRRYPSSSRRSREATVSARHPIRQR
jgi:hypothetical protein